MAQVQPIADAGNRIMATLVAGLEIEFGRGAGKALAQRFLDAEEVDFRWDARIEERWIGAYASIDDDDFALDRVRILGWLDGQWFVATHIVDGDGNAQGMLGCRDFGSEIEARESFGCPH
jgi:hypothetical protein